mmetsp:Transcript_14925/g.29009  ORF Transcript_14925/g.29009 Transcript_14925/m.29009 type:complete len:387 (-) Transcript_14925:367-1527(-)
MRTYTNPQALHKLIAIGQLLHIHATKELVKEGILNHTSRLLLQNVVAPEVNTSCTSKTRRREGQRETPDAGRKVNRCQRHHVATQANTDRSQRALALFSLILNSDHLEYLHVHSQEASRVIKVSNHVVNTTIRGTHDLINDVLARGLEVLKGVPPAHFRVDHIELNLLTMLVLKLERLACIALVGCHRCVHGVDSRQVLAGDNLGQVPAERTIRTCEVMDFLELVHLVQNNVELVVHSSKRVCQYRECFTRGTRLIRVKEEQNDICTLRKPARGALKVVSAITANFIWRRVRHAVHSAIDHSWTVHKHKVVNAKVRADLEVRVVNQIWAKCTQTCKTHVWTSDKRRSILIHILPARYNNCKSIICRCHASVLHAPLKHMVDEARLS